MGALQEEGTPRADRLHSSPIPASRVSRLTPRSLFPAPFPLNLAGDLGGGEENAEGAALLGGLFEEEVSAVLADVAEADGEAEAGAAALVLGGEEE